MNRIIMVVFLALLLICLQGCSRDNNESFEGTWIAKQATQKIIRKATGKMVKYKITEYNYWEINEGKINLSDYSLVNRNGKEEMEIERSGEEVTYEIISKSKIVIDNKAFDYEIKKQKMILKSDDLEIVFERDD